MESSAYRGLDQRISQTKRGRAAGLDARDSLPPDRRKGQTGKGLAGLRSPELFGLMVAQGP